MFRNISRIIPSFGSRFASSMVARPSAGSIVNNSKILFPYKQNVTFANAEKPQIINLNIFNNTNTVIEKIEPETEISEMIMTSVLRKRRLKMKKHKLRKRRKAQRALRIKIGK